MDFYITDAMHSEKVFRVFLGIDFKRMRAAFINKNSELLYKIGFEKIMNLRERHVRKKQ